MQIGLECFTDEQLSSMIASELDMEIVKFNIRRAVLYMIQKKIFI